METFLLSQDELIIALTNYLLDTKQIDENTPDGIMSYISQDDGGLSITIMPALTLN